MPRSDTPASTSPQRIGSDQLSQTITVRIKHKFRRRITEWGGSLVLMGLGYILAQPENTFTGNKSFVLLESWFPSETWALILGISGFFRLIGLIVNGSMESVTPWIRVTGAAVGFTYFALITASILLSHFYLGAPLSTGLAPYGMLACMELAAMYLAVIDARIYQNGKRERSAGHSSVA